MSTLAQRIAAEREMAHIELAKDETAFNRLRDMRTTETPS
jgi:hypothetical protein